MDKSFHGNEFDGRSDATTSYETEIKGRMIDY